MGYDVFLKLDDVTGDSQKENHVGEIDIISFSWEASNASSWQKGGGASIGKTTAGDFSIIKATDSSSSAIFLHCIEGELFKTVVVTLERQVNGTATPYLIYNFTGVYITSIRYVGSSEDDRNTPIESIGFCYKTFAADYTPVAEDGSQGNTVHWGWNIPGNSPA